MIDPMSVDLHQFITNWYGPASRNVGPSAQSYSNLPKSLAEWHEISAHWATPLVTLKKIFKPEEIITREGKSIFMSDPGDALWAFDAQFPNVVYEGRLYGDWVKLSENLPEFLIHNAMNEAAHNAPYTKSCDSVRNDLLQEILAPMTEVAFRGWQWPRPGHRIFLSESLIADVGPAMEDRAPWGNKPGFSEVQIGATKSSELTYLDYVQDVDWY